MGRLSKIKLKLIQEANKRLLNEQHTYNVNGREVSREEWVDYQLRNYMHISIDKTFKDNLLDKLTDLEKEQYCRLLPPVFDPEKDWDMFNDEPFEGDTSPCEV